MTDELKSYSGELGSNPNQKGKTLQSKPGDRLVDRIPELKTLKDIDICGTCRVEHCDCHNYPCTCSTSWCIHDDLKQEAIKHINSKRVVVCNEEVGIPVFVVKAIQNAWIKHFFNLTEEGFYEGAKR